MAKTVAEQVQAIKQILGKTRIVRHSMGDRLQACLNFYEATGQGDRDIELCRDYFDATETLRPKHSAILRSFITTNKVDIEEWS